MRIMAFRSPAGRRAVTATLLVVAGAAGPIAQAQQPREGSAARTFELRPRPGLEQQFKEGYRRHLDWHVRAGDPWTWYMWEVMDGERAGLYVDGTFGHSWSDFDRAVQPAADRADNARHVEPFVTRTGAQTWAVLPTLGGAPVDLEAASLVVRTEHRLRAGFEADFVEALRRLRPAESGHVYAVYRLVSGGDVPTYVLWTPARTWSDVGEMADLPAGFAAGDSSRQAAYATVLAASAGIRRELWRFRPDLSICRRAATRCHRTLGVRIAIDTARVVRASGNRGQDGAVTGE